ncbi:MAG TPA: SDR family oxidoreductase [Candidatus Binataceae bacterium]|nr:SDR family oxidoreductase [Candidatus Binataceae bacterium]
MISAGTAPAIHTAVVTGGAGFIGSHLVDALLEEGIRVRVIDNLSTGKREQVPAAADFIEADIRNPDSFREVFDGVDCVFHVAALARVPLSIERPVETHQVNVLGTLNVLVAARDAGVRRFIFSGSSSVYGDQPTLPLREEMPPNPLSPYAFQKLGGEQYTRLFCRLYGLETLTLRYFNVFGPRMILEGAYPTVIGAFLSARHCQLPLTICGDGEQTRDFTFVSDVARANLLAARCEVADGRAINIGRGCGVSVNRIAALLGGETVHIAERPGEPRHTLADLRQAASILGWRPEVSIEQGLAQLMRDSGEGLAPRA